MFHERQRVASYISCNNGGILFFFFSSISVTSQIIFLDCVFSHYSDRFKLDAVALNKLPEEVFDVVGKLGEGYASSLFRSYCFKTK